MQRRLPSTAERSTAVTSTSASRARRHSRRTPRHDVGEDQRRSHARDVAHDARRDERFDDPADRAEREDDDREARTASPVVSSSRCPARIILNLIATGSIGVRIFPDLSRRSRRQPGERVAELERLGIKRAGLTPRRLRAGECDYAHEYRGGKREGHDGSDPRTFPARRRPTAAGHSNQCPAECHLDRDDERVQPHDRHAPWPRSASTRTTMNAAMAPSHGRAARPRARSG